MARHHQPTRRVNPKPSLIPQELEPGKARCAGCSAVVTVNRSGTLRRHRAPSGEDCAYRVGVREVRVEDLPPVVLPPVRGNRPQVSKATPVRPPSRLDVGSNCKRCGKWLPGERSLCGACAAASP